VTPTQTYWRGRPAVYRCWDADGRLIYIGASRSVPQRLAQHLIESWWHGIIARIEVRLFPTIEAAFAVEKAAIKELRPAFNVKHAGRDENDFTHWTLADYRLSKDFQDRTWSRMYLPQSPREVGTA
jgi:excinuclease UvrABC nuclease subunit